MHESKHATARTAASCILACLPGVAAAEKPVELAAVVVTADRFRTSALEQPIAVQVITEDDIRDSTATTVAEILAKLGGVHTRSNILGVPDSPLDLRGFGMTGDQNTLVLLNGQRLSENELSTARLSAIPLNAIERIEILRGAGAVLYGGGATGGTINIITRSPLGGPNGGSVSAAVGGQNLRDLRASLQAGERGWGIAVHGQHYETDNYRRNNRAEQDSGSGELRLGDEAGFLALNLGADNQKARLPGARTEAQLSADPRGTITPNDYANTRTQTVGLRGERRFGDLTLAFDAGHRAKDVRFFFGPTSLQDTAVRVTSLTPRLLWNATLGGLKNRLTAGFDWSDWTYANRTSGFGNRDEAGTQTNRAVYVRDELALGPATRLTLGARRERVVQQQEERITPIPSARTSPTLSAHELALQQDFAGGFSAYGRLGRSFRVANIDENRCIFPPCAPLLKAQQSRDREIGLQWRNRGTAFRASLFEIALDDEIHFNALTFTNMNLSPTRRRGLELEGRTQLSPGLDLSARYAHTVARFRSGVYGGTDVGGHDVPMVPRDRASIGLGWQAAEKTRLVASASYVGHQRYDNDQANRFRPMPSYAVADLKMTHDAGAWRLSAGVNNLFDKAYYSYAGVFGTAVYAYPENRRLIYAGAEFCW